MEWALPFSPFSIVALMVCATETQWAFWHCYQKASHFATFTTPLSKFISVSHAYFNLCCNQLVSIWLCYGSDLINHNCLTFSANQNTHIIFYQFFFLLVRSFVHSFSTFNLVINFLSLEFFRFYFFVSCCVFSSVGFFIVQQTIAIGPCRFLIM